MVVIGGWLQQGGVSLVQSLFSEEDEPLKPLVNVDSSDDLRCTNWLLHDSPESVADALLQGMPRTAAPSTVEQEEEDGDQVGRAVAQAFRSTGSQVSTGDHVEVTIQANRKQAIVLTRLEVTVDKRSALRGDVMFVGAGCGGGVPARMYESDLDLPSPKFKLAKNSEVKKPVTFPYKVHSTEPEFLVLESWTKGYVEWKAKLHWVADGKSGVTEIADHGKPFVTFPYREAYYGFNTYTMKYWEGVG
ncbi:hypothetical protein ACIRJS_26530 [Streptomyces sp. NPDC102340]|uniref:hypothetical protein n=1 Tax=unclassified Streptomyces TaxID=2593676 RepID=UPI00380FD452